MTEIRIVVSAMIVSVAVFSGVPMVPHNVFAQDRAPDLASARAEEFMIAQESLLDATCFNCAPSFSPDSTRLAYIRNVADTRGEVRIAELPSGRLHFSFSTSFPVKQVAWSPDGKRLIAVPVNFRNETLILDLSSQTVTPIGRLPNTLSAGDEIFWTEPQGIYFLGGPFGSDRFDLETLSARFLGNFNNESYAALRARLSATPVDHPHVVLRQKPKQGALDLAPGQVFEVANRDNSFVQELESRMGTKWFSRNARYAVVEEREWRAVAVKPVEGLKLFVMGTRSAPIATGVTSSLAPLPADADPAQLADIRTRISRGAPVFATVRQARTNPLNNRLVGTTGTPKALVRIISVQDGAVNGRIVVLYTRGSVSQGDVLAEFIGPEPVARGDIAFPSVAALISRLSEAGPASVEAKPAPRQTPSIGASGPVESSQQSFAQLLAAAEAGDPSSQLRVGVAYATGKGVQVIGSEAVRWLESAVASDGKIGATAAGWLGVVHERGLGVSRSGEAAVKWYTQGAELGAGSSAQNLGELYIAGQLVRKDEKLGYRWYARAAALYEAEAAAGDANAAYQAARIYLRGFGVARDPTKAVALLERAASAGNADASKLLSEMRARPRNVR